MAPDRKLNLFLQRLNFWQELNVVQFWTDGGIVRKRCLIKVPKQVNAQATPIPDLHCIHTVVLVRCGVILIYGEYNNENMIKNYLTIE